MPCFFLLEHSALPLGRLRTKTDEAPENVDWHHNELVVKDPGSGGIDLLSVGAC